MKQPSEKSYAVAVCLSAIFGVMGIHHFYIGRYLEGVIDFSLFVATLYFYFTGQWFWAVLFFVVDGLHTFIITIMLLTGTFKDGEGNIICYPGQRLA
jgi:TM2 domain-containing membrane protein YozV